MTAKTSGPARYFVVGDVHGCADALEALVSRAPEGRRIVLLGDYVDRGPRPRRAVALVREWVRAGKVIALKGNHEDMMVRAILGGGTRENDAWLSEGGDATVDDYGADGKALVDDATFLDALPCYHEDPPYLFSHAGVPPELTLEEAVRGKEILWNRGWLSDRWQQVVGHTPTPEPIVHPGQWAGIDTGAYSTGVLTAILLPEWEIVRQGPDSRGR